MKKRLRTDNKRQRGVIVRAKKLLTDKCRCNDTDTTENFHDIQPDANVSNSRWNWSSIVNQKLPRVQSKLEDVVDLWTREIFDLKFTEKVSSY